LCAEASSGDGGVGVPSEGLRIDLSGFVRRVWGSGRSGELRVGVQD